MTFDEIEDIAPLSFHDAFLLGVSVDYVQRQATLLVEVWVGNSDRPTYAERESYRQIRLTFTGLLLCAVDVPEGEYLQEKPHGLQFDVAYDEKAEEAAWPDEPLPQGAFRRTFYFTQDLSSRVRVAAGNVTVEWLTEPRIIY